MDFRDRLRACVDDLDEALTTGLVDALPALDELEALAVLLDNYQLPHEAERVRQWVALLRRTPTRTH
jgi:hypothetical protein